MSLEHNSHIISIYINFQNLHTHAHTLIAKIEKKLKSKLKSNFGHMSHLIFKFVYQVNYYVQKSKSLSSIRF